MSWRLVGKFSHHPPFILSILVGLFIGTLILAGLSLKWIAAVAMMMSFILTLLVVHNVEKVLFVTIVFLIPFHIGSGLPAILDNLGHIGSARSLDIQLIDIFVTLLFLTQLASRTKIRGFSAITIPALMWIVFSFLSALSAHDVNLVVMQAGQMVKLFILYIVIANTIRDENDVKWLVGALILGAAFQGLLGIYQAITGSAVGFSFLGEPSQLFHGRSQGTIGHPNGYGAYLSAIMPLMLSLLFIKIHVRLKTIAIVSLGLCGLGLLFCLSRGGWVSFMVASAAVLIFVFERYRPTLKTIIGVSPTFVIFFLLLFSQRNVIAARLTSSQAMDSALSRISLAQGALAMLSDYPVVGVGLNNYSILMPKYDPFDFARENQIVIVHNVYLLVAAETGIVGLACFIWLLIALFIKARQIIRKAPNDITWLAGVGAFTAFTALAVHSITDYDVLANITVFRLLWLFSAVTASAYVRKAYAAVPS